MEEVHSIEPNTDDDDAILYEEFSTEDIEDETNNPKLEIVFLPQETTSNRLSADQEIEPEPSTSGMSRQEKFIQAVYPQFKGKTKLQLIEEILDLQRQNELLKTKAKTYEDTINRLLN